MDPGRLIDSLERFGAALPAVVAGVGPDDARWRPPEGAWSILEIVCHLADEEAEDFGARLRMTLEDPEKPWPAIDPPGWAARRRYNDGDLGVAVARFASLRRSSVRWLRGLDEPDFDRAYNHPRGIIRAGDLLASWAAHDALHLRQIAKRLYQLARRDAGGFSVGYAGEWTA